MESESANRRWTPIAGGLAIVVIAVWMLRDVDPVESVDVTTSTAEPAPESREIPKYRIEEHGRLSLDEADLPAHGPLELALALSDDARGTSDRSIRIVSLDGRRTDTTATLLPGSDSGVRFAIERNFLAKGRYMIEIDTADQHSLQIRRYVLEVN